MKQRFVTKCNVSVTWCSHMCLWPTLAGDLFTQCGPQPWLTLCSSSPSGDHPIGLILYLFPLLYIILMYVYIVIINIYFAFLPIFKHAINILPWTGGEGGVSSPHWGALLHVQGQIMIYIVAIHGREWCYMGWERGKWGEVVEWGERGPCTVLTFHMSYNYLVVCR
jgi:hypothetical protein